MRKPLVYEPRVPEPEISLHARAFHAAAKRLAAAIDTGPGTFTDLDVFPVVFMYRHALELHLKAMVLGAGGKFLPAMPDTISVHTTHSVSWLAQFVRQIVTAAKRHDKFQCEGIGDLAAFKAAVEELNCVDPGTYGFRCPVDPRSPSGVREFGSRMDALLDLLDSTADALASASTPHRPLLPSH